MDKQNSHFIITGLQSWYMKIGSNAKNIANELSKTNRVLYVNLPIKRGDLLKKNFRTDNKKIKKTKYKQPLHQINENLWVFNPRVLIESINFLPEGFLYQWLNKLNNKKFAKEIKWAASQLGFKQYYLINDTCMFEGLYLKEFLKPLKYVYYFRDNLINQPYFNKHAPACQSIIFKKADLVAANSRYLMEIAEEAGAKAVDVGQGCEFDHFDTSKSVSKPNILKNISKKIVGYVGTLSAMRLDIALIEYIAQKSPEVQFVLVGPEDETFKISNLHKLSNVLFTGIVPINELKNYLAFFDVCINPQLVNELTIGNYPIKIDEYLALGKPVVATRTIAMEMFNEFVRLSSSYEEFHENILKSVDDTSDDITMKRIAFAKSHSWENSVATLLKHLV